MKILCIDACISTHPESRTRSLCCEYLRQLESKGGTVERVELEALSTVPLTKAALEKRDALIRRGQYQDEMFALARQFREADRIVVAAPYWDLSFPSVLKVYVEHIMVCGLTFQYVETGSVGLCRASALTYITTAGGYIGNRNFGYEYIKSIAEMLGIGKADLLCAEGLDIAGADVAQILADTQIGLSECRTIPYPKSCQGHLREAEASDRISPRQKA